MNQENQLKTVEHSVALRKDIVKAKTDQPLVDGIDHAGAPVSSGPKRRDEAFKEAGQTLSAHCQSLSKQSLRKGTT